MSLIHWFIDSLSHRFIIHSMIHSLIHCFVGSLVRSFTEFLVHWFVDSLVHWLLDSLSLCFVALVVDWFIGSLIHWLTDSLVHDFRLIGSFTQFCTDLLMSFHWHLNNHLLIRWCTSQLQHFIVSASHKLLCRPLLSCSHVLFSKLPPRRGPGTTWYISL